MRTTSTGSSVLGTSPADSTITGSTFSIGSAPQSLPTFQHPSHALLKENGFTQQVYTRYRARCLKGKFFEISSTVFTKPKKNGRLVNTEFMFFFIRFQNVNELELDSHLK